LGATDLTKKSHSSYETGNLIFTPDSRNGPYARRRRNRS
jgi:hypothetical protein